MSNRYADSDLNEHKRRRSLSPVASSLGGGGGSEPRSGKRSYGLSDREEGYHDAYEEGSGGSHLNISNNHYNYNSSINEATHKSSNSSKSFMGSAVAAQVSSSARGKDSVILDDSDPEY